MLRTIAPSQRSLLIHVGHLGKRLQLLREFESAGLGSWGIHEDA